MFSSLDLGGVLDPFVNLFRSSPAPPVLRLPPEVFQICLSFLPLVDIVQTIFYVSKWFCDACCHADLWEILVLRDFSAIVSHHSFPAFVAPLDDFLTRSSLDEEIDFSYWPRWRLIHTALSMLHAPSGAAKAVFLGAHHVGKSSIIIRFTRDEFFHVVEMTIGASFLSPAVPGWFGLPMRLDLWDPPGMSYHNRNQQHSPRELPPMLCRGADVVLLIFSIYSRDSFEEATGFLYQSHLADSPPNAEVVLVANKFDRLEDSERQRELLEEEAEVWARENEIVLLRCSAKDGEGVDDVMVEVSRKAQTRRILQEFEDRFF